MIGEPPSFRGAVQERVAEVFPGVAITLMGGLGAPCGVTGDDGKLGSELPLEFLATTVNV